MDENTIRERLSRLHAELEDAHKQDPAARQSLGDILPDIKRVTERRASLTPGAASDASLADRLEKVAVQFEADHPAVAGSVRRLVDLLGEVGI